MPEKPPAPGSNQVRRALFEDRSPSRILRGWTTADGLTCGIDCQLVGSGWPEATATKLHNILQRHRVTTGINDRALESLAAEARNGNSTGMVVARGTPPEPGRPGALEFIVRPSGQKASFDQRQDSDRVDYHETNVVENVLAGDPVAIELLPRPGIDGLDVFGGTVKASHGRNAEYRLGENVSFDSDSRQILAAIDGRVVWDRNTVSVSRTFHVHGPVDYSVGNIAFVGDVIIDGEVLDGFTVSAGGDITVGGNVGSCKLDAEGSLTISGGVFGKGKAQLRAKGQLRAKFLNDCRAESSGLMIIEREVVGSTVYTNRALLVSGGRLVGGSASALAGIEVDILGSNLGVPTSVSSGTDYNMTRRQGEIEERIAEVDNSVGRISEFLGPLLGDHRRLNQLVNRRRGDLERLVRALRDLRGERQELAEKLEELAEASHRGAVRQINVRREMNPGTLLELGAIRHRVKKTARGPLSVIEDRARAALRTVEFRNLPGIDTGKTAAAKGRTGG